MLLNDLISLPLWVTVLTLVGTVATIRWLIWPIVWVVMYGIGHAILQALVIDWCKAKKRPLTLMKFLLLKWPLEGMKEAVIWPAASVTAGAWEWRPPFKFIKRTKS